LRTIFLLLKDMNAYDAQLKNLEDERDRFRRELHKYKRSSKEKVRFELSFVENVLINKFLGC